jgi:hypothetical protein
MNGRWPLVRGRQVAKATNNEMWFAEEQCTKTACPGARASC